MVDVTPVAAFVTVSNDLIRFDVAPLLVVATAAGDEDDDDVVVVFGTTPSSRVNGGVN